MTSREVVEIINSLRPEGKAELLHKNFLAKLLKLKEELAELNIQPGEYLDKNNQKRQEYLLDKEACMLMVASETPKVLQAIIRRWQDLENQVAKRTPMSNAELMLMQAQWNVEMEHRQAVLEVKMEAQEEINETVNSKLHSLSFEIKKAELTHERLTIPEYGKKTGRIISYDDSVIIGKIAFHMSMMNSVPVGEVPDSQYSSLRIYKKEILDYVVPFVFGDSSPDKDSKREVITHGGKKALVPNTFLKMKDLLLDHSVNITIQSIYGRFAAIGIIKYTASGQIAPEDWVLPYVVNVNPVSYQNQQLYWDVSFVQFIKYVLMGQFNVR
jgi:phage regulator Rha-like protein